MKHKPKIAIFTEASNNIGTGHLVESINVARLAGKSGIRFSFWVNKDCPKSVLGMIPFSYRSFSNFNGGKKILSGNAFDAAVFNFREIDNDVLHLAVKTGLKTVCIDELGGRRLDCDVIINSVAVAKYHRYPGLNNGPRLYIGAKYLCMSPGFKKAHKINRKFSGYVKELSVCMGGVDRSGATLNIIDALMGWKDSVRKNIILGAGFPHYPQIRDRLVMMKRHNFRIYRNVKEVVPFFLKSDVVFTAGGNTLYELACLGTPPIVLYEDEHEKENGTAFEKRGFGMCLGKGKRVSKSKILSVLYRLDDPTLRKKISLRGKHLVDGRGAERTLDIIKKLTRKKRCGC